MVATNPTSLSGPWDSGFALDLHTLGSQYLGDDAYGNPQFDTRRSPVGELLYKLKYRSDRSAGTPLCETAVDFIKSKQWTPNLIIPVPPSRPGRHFQPVPFLASGIARLLGCDMCEDCVVKIKKTPELKSIYDYQERLEQLKDAYSVAPEKIGGCDVLLIDDLYRSGATLEAVATALRTSGKAGRVFTLTFTRTRSNR